MCARRRGLLRTASGWRQYARERLTENGAAFVGEEETLAQLRSYLVAVGVPEEAANSQAEHLKVSICLFAPDLLCTLSARGRVSFENLAQESVPELPALHELEADVVEAAAQAVEEGAEKRQRFAAPRSCRTCWSSTP